LHVRCKIDPAHAGHGARAVQRKPGAARLAFESVLC
jgi:hypothetical protein